MAAAETPGPAADLAKLGQELLAQQRAIRGRTPDFVMPHPSLKKLVGPAASVSEAAVNEGLARCRDSVAGQCRRCRRHSVQPGLRSRVHRASRRAGEVVRGHRLLDPAERRRRGTQPGEGAGERRPGRAHRGVDERLQAPPPPGHSRNAGAGRASRPNCLNSPAPEVTPSVTSGICIPEAPDNRLR